MESGFVLLSNDRCLEGRVELLADRYVITRTEGNQVSIPRNQVQFVGGSKKELYRFKVRSLSPSARAGDHFKLARWCLSMQLLAESGEHYLKLIKTHPPETNSSVKRLGVEIKDSMLQQAEFRTYLGLAPIVASDSVHQSAAAPLNGGSVVAAASSTLQVSADQLPMQVKALFADQVQHILLNRCGQANCHGQVGSTALRLQPALGTQAASKTEDNMESVLRYISQSPSGRTAFIEFATKAHGQRNTPPIQLKESKLTDAIDQWLIFAESKVVTAEARIEQTTAGLRPVLPGSAQYRTVPGSIASVPASFTTHGERPNGYTAVSGESRIELQFPVGELAPTADEIDALDKLVTEQIGFPPVSELVNSHDPFDPAEFNRLRATAHRQEFQQQPEKQE